ncbi:MULTISPECIES: hypothetical protein [Emticicia]|nr:MULTISPECIES: hypothetical protein [Emticicia]UTA67491.1 hypothetical protein MB380_18090 [Emticicia sp. 21SJ11W-3]
MRPVFKKKTTTYVHFLLLLMFLFICRQFVSDAFRIYELTTNESELCLDISIEDSCSFETNFYGLEDADEYISSGFFNPVVAEHKPGKEAAFSASLVHEVYLGLNTPPPEQSDLFA